jgi:hypothetical protein
MQIICNFGFWKIGVFKKYHRNIFLFKLQNDWIIQNGADHYNFRSWTITFVFFNRFENQNMFWKPNFISYLFSLVWWWLKYSRWRFSDFLCFSSRLNCKLFKYDVILKHQLKKFIHHLKVFPKYIQLSKLVENCKIHLLKK